MMAGLLLGLAVGAVLGLTGAGGGIFAVPALVFGLEMEIRQAAPLALLAVGAAAGLGALQGLRQGVVRYRAAVMLALAGALTAPLGLMLAHRLPAAWLSVLFAAIMLVVAYRMYRGSRAVASQTGETAPRACRISAQTGRFVWTPRTAVTLGGIGLVSGLFTGMLGVGGGFIIVPALAHFSELRMQSIVATSLMVIALLSAVTVSIAWGQGMAMDAPAWAFLAAAVAGMGAGRLVSNRIPAAALQQLFALACVAVAAMMVWRSF